MTFREWLRQCVAPWCDFVGIPRERLAYCIVSMPRERRTPGAILMTVDWIRTQMAGRRIGKQLRDTH